MLMIAIFVRGIIYSRLSKKFHHCLLGTIESIPEVLQTVIDHLVQWRLIPEGRKPNSCIINFFDEVCSILYISICMVSFLHDSKLHFACRMNSRSRTSNHHIWIIQSLLSCFLTLQWLLAVCLHVTTMATTRAPSHFHWKKGLHFIQPLKYLFLS